MPKRNYGFEKRQKELAKARKKQEKARRKAERAASPQSPDEPGDDEADTATDVEQ